MISSRKQEIGKNGESSGERMQEEKEEGEKGKEEATRKNKNNAQNGGVKRQERTKEVGDRRDWREQGIDEERRKK